MVTAKCSVLWKFIYGRFPLKIESSSNVPASIEEVALRP
jgi:hypothetical protein